MSVSSLEGVLNGFGISLPRSFPLWWYAWTIWQRSSCSQCSSLIILQQSISILMHARRSWGSSPSLAMTSSSSPRCTWVLTLCVIPCCILSRKVEVFALVTLHSSLMPVGIHCPCISRDLVPRAARHIRGGPCCQVRCSWGGASSPGYAKNGERVVCIFWVPVIDG